MGKTLKVNFERARKRRQIFQTVKRFFILGLVMLSVVGAVVLNNFLVEQSLSIHVSDIVESFGGQGFPVDLPGGIIRDVKNLGKDLAVLNDTNLYIYSPKARLISSIQQMSDNTVLCTSDSRILTYDAGSKRYRIFSPSKLLAEKDIEDSILTSDLGAKGEYALVTSPKRFVAMVTVFNAKFEPIFYSYSAENHITGVALSPKGDMMVTSSVNTENGMLKSYVHYYRFDSEEEVGRILINDSLILRMDFLEENRVTILTDKEYTVTDNQGNQIYSYSMGENPVTAFRTFGREALILTEYKEARRNNIILLNAEGEEAWHLNMANNVRDMAVGAKYAYILDDSGISAYGRDGKLENKMNARGITRIHFAGDKLYYFTQDEIRVLE